MKRNIRHIRARNDEWVQVHRNSFPPSPDGDWLLMLLFKIGGCMLAVVIVCQIIKALMPIIVLGALGWLGLYVFGKWGKR